MKLTEKVNAEEMSRNADLFREFGVRVGEEWRDFLRSNHVGPTQSLMWLGNMVNLFSNVFNLHLEEIVESKGTKQ